MVCVHGLSGSSPIDSFMGGALGSWGAALLQPYSDRPDFKGFMLASYEHLSGLVHRFHRDGWQVVCRMLFSCPYLII